MPRSSIACTCRWRRWRQALVVGGWLDGQWAANRLRLSRPTVQATGICLAALAAVSLGILAFQRNADYRDEHVDLGRHVDQSTRQCRAHTTSAFA